MKKIWQYRMDVATYENLIRRNRKFVILYRDSFQEVIQQEIDEIEQDMEVSKIKFKAFCKLNSDLLFEKDDTILLKIKIGLDGLWYTFNLRMLSRRMSKLRKVYRRFLAVKIRGNQIITLCS